MVIPESIIYLSIHIWVITKIIIPFTPEFAVVSTRRPSEIMAMCPLLI